MLALLVCHTAAADNQNQLTGDCLRILPDPPNPGVGCALCYDPEHHGPVMDQWTHCGMHWTVYPQQSTQINWDCATSRLNPGRFSVPPTVRLQYHKPWHRGVSSAARHGPGFPPWYFVVPWCGKEGACGGMAAATVLGSWGWAVLRWGLVRPR